MDYRSPNQSFKNLSGNTSTYRDTTTRIKEPGQSERKTLGEHQKQISLNSSSSMRDYSQMQDDYGNHRD